MSFIPKGQEPLRAELDRALALFVDMGAELVDVSTLLRAELMLDLYGEEIRNRAFIVHDGVDGDFVLRPDFTVPVVQTHLASGKKSARYAYSGRVWRKKQDPYALHKHSFLQTGIEIFDEDRRAENDAELFELARQLAKPNALKVATGDLGLVFSLLDQMEISIWRKEALKRQFWRPRAFEALLKRYASAEGKHVDLEPAISAPVIGLRSEAMIKARIDRLKHDAQLPPIKSEDIQILRAVLSIQGSLEDAREALAQLLKKAPQLEFAFVQFDERLEAMRAREIPLADIAFDASFGRETMEYYDGFVFQFSRADRAVIAGGRYDQLVQQFETGQDAGAVGMAYRPELLAEAGA